MQKNEYLRKLSNKVTNKTRYLKSPKTNCTCPNSIFKNDESNEELKEYSLQNPPLKNEIEKTLRVQLKKNGKVPEAKHKNYPKYNLSDDTTTTKKVDVIKHNKISVKEDFSSMPDKYVQDLRREVGVGKKYLPILPKEYLPEYIESIKQEIILNKLASHCDNNKILRDIRTEISDFRTQKSTSVPITTNGEHLNKNIFNKASGKGKIHRSDAKGNKSKGVKKKTTAMKKKQQEIAEERLSSPINDSSLGKAQQTIDRSTSIEPGKRFVDISTQYEFESIERYPQKLKGSDFVDKIDIHNIVPELSCIIEKSEKNLEHTILKVIRPTKILQERAVSPMDQTLITQTLEITTIDGNESKIEKKSGARDLSPTDSLLVGNLLVNIDNIKENRTLLTDFQKELTKIKADMKECAACKNLIDKYRSCTRDNIIYCDKHSTYYPLLKMDDVGSANDQIRIFGNLKTEILLEKEMKEQKEKISKLIQDLHEANLTQNMNKIRDIEAALELSKSYLNNLQIKQTNERLLNEQQHLLKTECFQNLAKIKVREMPDTARTSENKNFRSGNQRLNIQKMPSIEIRKSLQLQTNLTLSIPPSKASPDISRKNVIYETIVSNWDKNKYLESHQSAGRSTRITNTTNICEQKPYHYDRTFEHSDLCQEVPDKLEGKKEMTREICGNRNINGRPSRLGSKISVGTQCNSMTLNKPNQVAPLNEMASAETQTAITKNDSNYLFGFREYLMKKKTVLSEEIAVSVSIQASLAGSNESMTELKFNGDRTSSVSAPVKNNIVTNVQKSPDYEGVAIMMAPVSSEIDFKATEQIPSRSKEENVLNEFAGRRLHTVERAPSLRKMFLPPNEDISDNHQKVKMIRNDPKKDYNNEIKDTSIPKEEQLEPIPEGDVFYKSLIKEEFPDRKLMTSYDSHLHVKYPLEEPIQDSSLSTSLQSEKKPTPDSKRSNGSHDESRKSNPKTEENFILALVEKQFSEVGQRDRKEYHEMIGLKEIETDPLNSFFRNQVSSVESILEKKTDITRTSQRPSLGENGKLKVNSIDEDIHIIPDELDAVQIENSGRSDEKLTSDSENIWEREVTDVEREHKALATKKILVDKKVSIDEKFLGDTKSLDTVDTNEFIDSNNEEKEKAIASPSQKSYRVETYKNSGKFILSTNFPWEKPLLMKKSDKLHECLTRIENKERNMASKKSKLLAYQTNTNDEINVVDCPKIDEQLLEISVTPDETTKCCLTDKKPIHCTVNARRIFHIARERQEYLRKCTKSQNNSESHSIGTSEGEVECKDGIFKNSTQHLEQSSGETSSCIPLTTQKQRYRQSMIQNSTKKSYVASSPSSAESTNKRKKR